MTDNQRQYEEIWEKDDTLDKIRAEIGMYEADCRLQGGTDECEKCNSNVFGSIYRIIDKYKAKKRGMIMAKVDIEIIVQDVIERVIQNLRDNEALVGRWIPVSERLPEDGTWAIFTDGSKISIERYKVDIIDHFFPQGRWFEFDDVVAWMPLPERYEAESEEE